MLVKATGTLSVEPHKGRIVVNVSHDFVRYYHSFIEREYWISLGLPMHGSHITVANTAFHKNINWKKALNYHGKEVEFEYDVDMIRGGFTKGFIMFYMRVYSEFIDTLKDKLQIVENAKFKGTHITIGNSKGTNLRMYWPDMITVKPYEKRKAKESSIGKV